MKYKIISDVFYSHVFDKYSGLYRSVREIKYGAKRKGTILGFWHDVGEWMCDSQNNNFCCEDWFDSREQCESFLKCWHLETYGEDKPLEIIN